MTERFEVHEDTAVIYDPELIKDIVTLLGLPTQVNKLVFSPKNLTTQVEKAVDKTIGGHRIERAAKVEIKTIYDDLMEKYNFKFASPDFTTAELSLPEDIAKILYVVHGFSRPEDSKPIKFENNDFKFVANVSFAAKIDPSDNKYTFGPMKLTSIQTQNKKQSQNSKKKVFQAIYNTFCLDSIKNMYRFVLLAQEYGFSLKDEIVQLEEDGTIPSDIRQDLSLNLCRSSLDPLPNARAFGHKQFIPIPMAVFLVEALALNQTDEENGYDQKRFLKSKTIYKLLLPAILPVAFELEGQYVAISFADYMGIKAVQICQRLTTIVQRIFVPLKNSSRSIYAQLDDVLYNIYSQSQIIQSNQTQDYISVMTKQQKTGKFHNSSNEIVKMRYELKPAPKTEGLTNIYIYMFPLSTAKDEIDQITEKFKENVYKIFEEIAYYECPLCNCQSCHKVHSCPRGQHTGERISFKGKNGEDVMEEKIQVLDENTGQTITQTKVCYSCCGTQILEISPGCIESDKHVMPDENNLDEFDYKIWSKLNYTVLI